jgi:glycerophosphoryl diester phosphodiesterase
MNRPLVIAHRGASGERPENTLLAFERAVEQTADMIETDLHLTRDGVIVLHHDASLDRLGAEGEIRDRTAAELAVLDVAPETFAAERMPTLPDLLDGFGARIAFNLELKVGLEAPYDGLEERVIEELETRDMLSRMLLSCFDDRVLERVRAISANARLAVLASPRAPRAMIERARRVGAEAINPHCFLVDEELVRSAHAEGLAVYPYTANELPEMTRLLDCGVDGVISNYPARLRELVDARENA